MENLKKLNEIFADVFSVNETSLNDEFKKDNVSDWDSIHQLNLISSIEDAFDLLLDSDDMLSLISYKETLELLQEKYQINLSIDEKSVI